MTSLCDRIASGLSEDDYEMNTRDSTSPDSGYLQSQIFKLQVFYHPELPH